jgi:hypothetical protein
VAVKPRPPRSGGKLHTFLGITGWDVVIVMCVLSVLIFYLLGPSWVRDVPRNACIRMWRRPQDVSGIRATRTRSVELESVGLVRNDVDDSSSAD